MPTFVNYNFIFNTKDRLINLSVVHKIGKRGFTIGNKIDWQNHQLKTYCKLTNENQNEKASIKERFIYSINRLIIDTKILSHLRLLSQELPRC